MNQHFWPETATRTGRESRRKLTVRYSYGIRAAGTVETPAVPRRSVCLHVTAPNKTVITTQRQRPATVSRRRAGPWRRASTPSAPGAATSAACVVPILVTTFYVRRRKTPDEMEACGDDTMHPMASRQLHRSDTVLPGAEDDHHDWTFHDEEDGMCFWDSRRKVGDQGQEEEALRVAKAKSIGTTLAFARSGRKEACGRAKKRPRPIV